MVNDRLAFLEEFIGVGYGSYSNARFLKSDYFSAIWRLEFEEKNNLEINWDVDLPDGLTLTSKKHSKMLEVFRKWVLAQDSLEAGGGLEVSQATIEKRVRRILHLINFLLLNAETLQLSKCGLKLISKDQTKALLSKLHSDTHLAFGLYGWNDVLSNWLRANLTAVSQKEVTFLKKKKPELLEEPLPAEDRQLSLSEAELIQARLFLYSKGWGQSGSKYGWSFLPNTARLAEEVYSNLVYIPTRMPIPYELGVGERESNIREFPASPCKTNLYRGKEPMDDIKFGNFLSSFRSMGLLKVQGHELSEAMLEVITSKTPLAKDATFSVIGRVRTLPQSVVFDSIENAIVFTRNYGEDLVSSYLKLAKAANFAGVSIKEFSKGASISAFLTKQLRELGVNSWLIESDIDEESNSYFSRFRKNEGLYALIRVLYGSVQIVVGALMARRVGEMSDLVAHSCMDDLGKYLIFSNRKSGALGIRQNEARPIHPEPVKMIRLLESLQKGLKNLGIIKEYTNLFAFPSKVNGLIKFRHHQFNSNFDFFCDYTETLLTQKGERYYIRQHQLRRFFAMLFFWGGKYGSLDTLRWFLGHTDIEHLYRYITESTQGKALTSAKAAYVTGTVRANNLPSECCDTESLKELLEQRFSTREFELIDELELEEQLEDWLDEGLLIVEPEFFEDDSGKEYRILIKVFEEVLINEGG